MTAFRIKKVVLWVQNVRFIAKIGPKLKGNDKKTRILKKNTGSQYFFIYFFQNRQFQVNCYHMQISKIKFSNFLFFKKKLSGPPIDNLPHHDKICQPRTMAAMAIFGWIPRPHQPEPLNSFPSKSVYGQS